MKLDLVSKTIATYADGLAAGGATLDAAGLRMLSTWLAQHPQKSAVRFVAGLRIGDCNVYPQLLVDPSSITIKGVTEQLGCLSAVVSACGGKAEMGKDLALLCGMLRKFDDSDSLSAVIRLLREAMTPVPTELLIAKFIERLKSELGTFAFEDTLAELQNSDIKKEHIVQIAKAVYGQIKSDSSRAVALRFIRKPHDAYMSAKRGIDATGGRSAA
jgi:hypothetical protein